MLSGPKPREHVDLPTQSPDGDVLEDILARFSRPEPPSFARRALGGSTSAILSGQGLSLEEQQGAEEYKEENPNWVRDGVETLVNMAASLPTFLAGSAPFGGPETPVGLAGGFALDTAIRTTYQKYLEAVRDGRTTLSFEDWMEVGKETGKSAALGGAIGVASPWFSWATNNAVVSKLLRTPLSRSAAEKVLEAGAFTAGGAAIGHGEMTLEDFRDNLIAITGFKLGHKVVDKLYKKHKQTGQPVEELAKDPLLLEYKPEIPITPEQQKAAAEISRKRKPIEKRTEEELFETKNARTNEPVEGRERTHFEEGLKRIADVETEKRDLKKIEDGIREIEKKDNDKFASQLKEDLQQRIKDLKVRQEAISEAEQKELKLRAEKDLQELEYAQKRKAKQEVRETKQKNIEHERKLREKEKEYERRGSLTKKVQEKVKESQERRAAEREKAELDKIEKGIQDIIKKEKRDASDSEFLDNAKKEIAGKLKYLKKRHAELKAKEQAALYKQAIEAEKLAKKAELEAKQEKKSRNLQKRKELEAKKQQETAKISNEPTPRERFETEKEMNRPLSERLDSAIGEREANVKRLYSQLYESIKKQEPRAIKKMIRDKIDKEEYLVKELKNAKKKRSSKTVAEDAKEISKTKGNKDYQERVQKAADSIAQNILEKASREPLKKEFDQAAKDDLKSMGIDLRCI